MSAKCNGKHDQGCGNDFFSLVGQAPPLPTFLLPSPSSLLSLPSLAIFLHFPFPSLRSRYLLPLTFLHISFFVRLQNDLYCVEWGVKLYSLTPSLSYILSSPFPYKWVSEISPGGLGERCKIPAGGGAELQPKLNSVHFSFKICHLVAATLSVYNTQLKILVGQNVWFALSIPQLVVGHLRYLPITFSRL